MSEVVKSQSSDKMKETMSYDGDKVNIKMEDNIENEKRSPKPFELCSIPTSKSQSPKRNQSQSSTRNKSRSPKRSSSRSKSRSPIQSSKRSSSRSESRSPSQSSKRSSSQSESRSPSQSSKQSSSRSESRSPSQSSKRSSSQSKFRSRSRSPNKSQNGSNDNRQRRYKRKCRSRSRSQSRSKISFSSRGSGNYRPRSRSPMSCRRRHIGSRDAPPVNRCLGIFGLSIRTQERDLRNVFSKFGNIEDVQIVYDSYTGRSRGFAFIYFEDKTDATIAKNMCNGICIDDRQIRVDFSITTRAHSPTPGIYMGRNDQMNYRSDSRRDGRRENNGHYEKRQRRSPSPTFYRRRDGYRRRYSRSRSRSPRRESSRLY